MRRDLDQLPDVPQLPPDITYEISRPSWRGRPTVGRPHTWQLRLFRCRAIFGGRWRAYRTIVLRDGAGRVVHEAFVVPRYYRFPFMGPSDVQIGGLYTSPERRGEGIASVAVALLLHDINEDHDPRKVWYVCKSDNQASTVVAERNGFWRAATALRRTGATGLFRRFRLFDFHAVTELGDMPGNDEQRRMARQRFGLAAQLAEGRRYLEVGSGSGYGFVLPRSSAAFAVGAEFSWLNLREHRQTGPADDLVQADAERLPFAGGSFDVVACLEALYYFPHVEAFVREAARVLAPGGRLLLTMPHPGRRGFNESPGSVRYPMPGELAAIVETAGFDADLFGSFPWGSPRRSDSVRELIRRHAVHLHLIPVTLAGRARLKRLLYRGMQPLRDLDLGTAASVEMVPIGGTVADQAAFTIVTVVASRR